MRFGDTLPPELDHDPFKAILTPRPIGWIGSRSAGGVANLAPYSFFCGVCAKPNMVGFASEGLKHSFANARDRGVRRQIIWDIRACFRLEALAHP